MPCTEALLNHRFENQGSLSQLVDVIIKGLPVPSLDCVECVQQCLFLVMIALKIGSGSELQKVCAGKKVHSYCVCFTVLIHCCCHRDLQVRFYVCKATGGRKIGSS